MVTGQMLYPAYLLIHSRSEDFDYSGVPQSGEDISGYLNGEEDGEDPPHPGFISGKVVTNDGSHWTKIEVVFSTQKDLDNFLQINWTQLMEDYIEDCS
jgi:hypothetical protein